MGALRGAFLGIDAIPVSWIEALKWKKELEKTVEPLLEKYFQVSGDKLKS